MIDVSIDNFTHAVAGDHGKASWTGKQSRSDNGGVSGLGVGQCVDFGVDHELATGVSIRPVYFTPWGRSVVSASYNGIIGAGDDSPDLDPWILTSLGGGGGQDQQILIPARAQASGSGGFG